MKCAIHHDQDAVSVCNYCGRSVCSGCLVTQDEERYCKECVELKAIGGKKLEHSPFLAALLSFVLPGAGQLYNAQYGKAIAFFLTAWLVIPYVMGITDAYSTAKRMQQEGKHLEKNTGCLIGSLVGMVLALCGIFFLVMLASMGMAFFHGMRQQTKTNEFEASRIVHLITTATEHYYAQNGRYPANEEELTAGEHPFLEHSYNNQVINGYIVNTIFYTNGYRIVANPQQCGVTGNSVFVGETDAQFSTKQCQ